MSATLKIDEVARLLGISRNLAYQQAKSGEIAGVKILRVGSRLLVPRKPFLEVLGEIEEGGDAE